MKLLPHFTPVLVDICWATHTTLLAMHGSLHYVRTSPGSFCNFCSCPRGHKQTYRSTCNGQEKILQDVLAQAVLTARSLQHGSNLAACLAARHAMQPPAVVQCSSCVRGEPLGWHGEGVPAPDGPQRPTNKEGQNIQGQLWPGAAILTSGMPAGAPRNHRNTLREYSTVTYIQQNCCGVASELHSQ